MNNTPSCQQLQSYYLDEDIANLIGCQQAVKRGARSSVSGTRLAKGMAQPMTSHQANQVKRNRLMAQLLKKHQEMNAIKDQLKSFDQQYEVDANQFLSQADEVALPSLHRPRTSVERGVKTKSSNERFRPKLTNLALNEPRVGNNDLNMEKVLARSRLTTVRGQVLTPQHKEHLSQLQHDLSPEVLSQINDHKRCLDTHVSTDQLVSTTSPINIKVPKMRTENISPQCKEFKKAEPIVPKTDHKAQSIKMDKLKKYIKGFGKQKPNLNQHSYLMSQGPNSANLKQVQRIIKESCRSEQEPVKKPTLKSKNRRDILRSPSNLKLFDSKASLHQIAQANCQKMLQTQISPLSRPYLQWQQPQVERKYLRKKAGARIMGMERASPERAGTLSNLNQSFDVVLKKNNKLSKQMDCSVAGRQQVKPNQKRLRTIKKTVVQNLRSLAHQPSQEVQFSEEQGHQLSVSNLLIQVPGHLTQSDPVSIQIQPDPQSPRVQQKQLKQQSNDCRIDLAEIRHLQEQVNQLKAQVNRNRHTREVVIQTDAVTTFHNAPEQPYSFALFNNSQRAAEGFQQRDQDPPLHSATRAMNELEQARMDEPPSSNDEFYQNANQLSNTASQSAIPLALNGQSPATNSHLTAEQGQNPDCSESVISQILFTEPPHPMSEVALAVRSLSGSLSRQTQLKNTSNGLSEPQSRAQVNKSCHHLSKSSEHQINVQINLCQPDSKQSSEHLNAISPSDMTNELPQVCITSKDLFPGNDKLQSAKTLLMKQSTRLHEQMQFVSKQTMYLPSIQENSPKSSLVNSIQKEQALEALLSQSPVRVQSNKGIEPILGFGIYQRLHTVANQIKAQTEEQTPIKAELPQIIPVGNQNSNSSYLSSSSIEDEMMEQPQGQVQNLESVDLAFVLQKSQTFTNQLRKVSHKSDQEKHLEHWAVKYSNQSTKRFKTAPLRKQSEITLNPIVDRYPKSQFKCERKCGMQFDSEVHTLSMNLNLLYCQLLNSKSAIQQSDIISTQVEKCIHNALTFNRKFQFNGKVRTHHQLISIADLNFKYIRDQNLQKKLERNIRLLQSDQVLLSEREQIKRSIVFRVTKYVTKFISSGSIVDRFYLLDKDEQVWNKLRSFQTLRKLQIRHFKQLNEYDKLLRESESKLKKFIWKKTLKVIDEPMFVRILSEDLLKHLSEPVLLNSLKTKAEVLGVSAYIDWHSIQEAAIQFEDLCAQFPKQQVAKLQKQVGKALNVKLSIGKVYYMCHPEVFAHLQKSKVKAKRLLHLTFKYKLGYCRDVIRNAIVDNIYTKQRFEWIRKLIQTAPVSKAIGKENNITHKVDRLKMPCLFKQYPEYQFVTSRWLEEVGCLVFNHSKQTLYKYLIQPENDVIAYALINHLYRAACKRFEYKHIQIKGVYQRLFGWQGNLEFKNPVRRYNSNKSLTPLELSSHHQISRDLLVSTKEAARQEVANSEYGDVFAVNKTPFFRKIKRSNAINDFDSRVCEYAIFEILQKNEFKIRDHHLLMYKEPSKWIQTDDHVLNRFRQEFCLKSQVVRDHQYPVMIMEVFKASDMNQTMRKLAQATRSQTINKRKLNKQREVEQLEEQGQAEKGAKAVSKELQSVMPPDFQTDDSMRDIDYEDVKSDDSLSEQEEVDKDSQYEEIKKKLKLSLFNITQVESPLKYYQNLSLLNSGRPKRTSMRKKRVFEMVRASDLEKVGDKKKKREQTLMDINLTFVDELMYIKNDQQEEANFIRKQQRYIQQVVAKCQTIEFHAASKGFEQKVRKVVQSQSIQQTLQNPLLKKPTKVAQKKFKGIVKKMSIISPSSRATEMDLDFVQRMKSYQKFKVVNTIRRVRSFYIENKFSTGNEIEIMNDLKKAREQRKSKGRVLKKGWKHSWSNSEIKKSELNWRQLSSNRKLHSRMKSVTDRLNVKFLLEIPSPDTNRKTIVQERRQYSSDAAIQKKFEASIFEVFISQNYQKIDDMLRRYFITASNMQTKRGDSLLALAVHLGDERLVHILLQKGINPNTQNKDGDTPLHFAINHGRMNLADILIEAGADESIANKRGLNVWGKPRLG